MTYVLIASVHVLRTFTRDGGAITRCGRRVPPPVTEFDDLPLTDRSCETCLRLTAHDADIESPDNAEVPT